MAIEGLRRRAISRMLERQASVRRTVPRSAFVTTILARLAKRSVLTLSTAWCASGEMVQMTTTFALPPRLVWSSRVSLLSR